MIKKGTLVRRKGKKETAIVDECLGGLVWLDRPLDDMQGWYSPRDLERADIDNPHYRVGRDDGR